MVQMFLAFSQVILSYSYHPCLISQLLSRNTVNPLYNGIRYNSKIRNKVNSICIKISGLCTFSLTVQCYSLGKHAF